ncbi:carboxypeptidase-like regulatory domain-containing protein [Luteibacter aegosomaticola]|uniref:carboxypeptidase-like regulatory domain-containing protein n=1 Tax=Luteibacter aegosomaticola TaxID=2911538 RepID=UPI001FF7C6AB|nr:carboxypeptidase-like regulatory domain-containing protein [Luteibacter aegosomaticola]UPG88042.1 carboxypeptidase-like regulatory domain-containing protein [Luteibacter aegosomaticola]
MKVRFVFAGLLAVAASVAHAQGTAGSIFGHGPAGASVTATSSTGSQRHAEINGRGRYTLTPLPMGEYTVVLEREGQTLDTRKNIKITVGRGAQVDFACPEDKCEAGG